MASGLRTLPTITVATAGTRVAVLASNPSPQKLYSQVIVTADKANTGKIFVGDLNVSATQYTEVITAGQSFTFSGNVIDPARIFVDTDTNGSKVTVSVVH
jgi:hypothetical protein